MGVFDWDGRPQLTAFSRAADGRQRLACVFTEDEQNWFAQARAANRGLFLGMIAALAVASGVMIGIVRVVTRQTKALMSGTKALAGEPSTPASPSSPATSWASSPRR